MEKLFTVSFYQPLVGKVSPSEPWIFYSFTDFNFAVSCAERQAAVDDTEESEHEKLLHVFNHLSASAKMLQNAEGSALKAEGFLSGKHFP